MKLTFFLFTITFLHASATGVAQNVSLNGKNLSLEQVFEAVEKQTGYVFLFPRTVLNKAVPVNVDAKNMPLTDFLAMVFESQPLGYVIGSKTINVTPVTAERSDRHPVNKFMPAFDPPPSPISGRVLDSLGNPLAGASVTIRKAKDTDDPRKNISTSTSTGGTFTIMAEEGDILTIRFIGYQPREMKVTGKMLSPAHNLVINLIPAVSNLDEIEVTTINTGYQKLKPNEMAGSVDVITKSMLMEQTGTTILDRLNGMVGSLNFHNKVLPGASSGNPNSVLNMTIRGYSTIIGTTDPLIIVNNFPYTGDIDNIDPNDVESIVILKDAAATAMWGIRAANGVIVITTSGSKFNQKTRINYRTTISMQPKPDLSKIDIADGPEVYDFIAETRGKSASQNLSYSATMPELEYVGWQYYKGHITEAEFNAKLDRLKAMRPRDQWSELMYRNGISQSHSLNISGGAGNISWTLAANREDRTTFQQAKSNRNNVRMNTAFKLTKNLRLELGITYTKSHDKTGAPTYNSGQFKSTIGLQNADGSPYGWYINYGPEYMDTVGRGLLGDLKFYPLNDWKYEYTTRTQESYVKDLRIVYTPFTDLDISVNVQAQDQKSISNRRAEQESYYTRYAIAKMSIIDYSRNSVTSQIPKGEIHRIKNIYANSFNARLDLNYRKQINKGRLVLNGAFDISESVNRSEGQFIAGYNKDLLNYTNFPTATVQSTISRGTFNPDPNLGIREHLLPTEYTQRNISTTASLSYIYDERLIFNANARRDGANILGVNVNERWKPNYSVGFNWQLHKERFFKVPVISTLTTGISFGYVGNVDVSKSNRIVGNLLTYINTYTALPDYFSVTNPPNPELRWEKTAHTNIKLNVGLFKDRIQVNTNYFFKNISDLYQATTVDPLQTFSGIYVANAGKMQVKGYEITVTAAVIKRAVSYDVTFSTAKMREKITYYPDTRTKAQSLREVLASDGVSLTSLPSLLTDLPLFSIISFDGEGGGVNNQGQYEIKYDGKVFNKSNDLLNYIITNDKQDMKGIRYWGTGTPTFTGSFHNRLAYKGFSAVISLRAEMGHVFRYPKDDGVVMKLSKAFENRWRKPGDEAFTNIPRYSSPNDPSWKNYTDYSGDNILKGDIIRINNIQLGYTLPNNIVRKLNMRNLSVALNAQNLGKIWTANKQKYDYQNLNYLTWDGPNRYYAFTLNVGL